MLLEHRTQLLAKVYEFHPVVPFIAGVLSMLLVSYAVKRWNRRH